MRSFVFRRQTLTKRQEGGGNGSSAPRLPPRGDTGTAPPSSAPAADAALAAFAVADQHAAGGPRGGGGGGEGGMGRPSRQASRKSVAGAVGGGWEASGAHAASTLADVFPDDEGGGSVGSDGGGGDPATRGVSTLVTKFLEGPALERFGGGNGGCGGGNGGTGGGILRRSSVGTSSGRRSTMASGRRSSASVRFVDGGRRSTVGGWGEGDEAARPGASVCKDCLSDVGSLLAVAMAPAEAARTTMEVRRMMQRLGGGGPDSAREVVTRFHHCFSVSRSCTPRRVVACCFGPVWGFVSVRGEQNEMLSRFKFVVGDTPQQEGVRGGEPEVTYPVFPGR